MPKYCIACSLKSSTIPNMQSQRLIPWLIFSFSQAAYRCSITDLFERHPSLDDFIQDNTRTFPDLKNVNWNKIHAACRWAEQDHHHILPFNHADYPALLKHIAHPPPLLYVKGNIQHLSSRQIAVVGSRQASHAGRELSHYFASELVAAGFCITSGLALGIDAMSHQAALSSDGATIAVLGNGLHSIYPKRHQRLADKIVHYGCLVSEFPLDAPPHAKHFPQRNRIISGLSLATLVIEAKRRSGSLITAHCAADQGRDVFAVPGSVRHQYAGGCHQLLREGAMLTESIADILDALNISSPKGPHLEFSTTEKPILGLDPAQRQLLACVDNEGTSIDTVIERSRLDASAVASQLLTLELLGYIITTERGYARIK